MQLLSLDDVKHVSGAGDTRVGIDWDRDGNVDENGTLTADGRLIGDSGRTSATWEWDNDANTNWWDSYNPLSDPSSDINTAVNQWWDAFTETGNVGGAAGDTVGDAPSILGDAFDVFWREALDNVIDSFVNSYDVWDVTPAGHQPQAPSDDGTPAVNNPSPHH